jgi:uncharacterized membrane protein
MISTASLVFRWCKLLKIPVSRRYITKQINSHPDFPSLLSVTETFEKLGIDHVALEVTREDLPDIPVPFLVHLQRGQGSFMLVEDVSKIEKQFSHFNETWKGVVVAAEKPERIHIDKRHAELIAEEKKMRLGFRLGLSFFLLIVSVIVAMSFTITDSLLLLSALGGLSLAVLIAKHELGIEDKLTEKICSFGKQTNCDAVLKSSRAKIFFGLKWSDLSIIYFTSMSIILLFGFLYGSLEQIKMLFSITAAATLPFTIFSIYYQWRILKKWCTLCLLSIGVLWIQATLLSGSLLAVSGALLTGNLYLILPFIFTTTAMLWLLLIKPVLLRLHESETKQFALAGFKKDPKIFAVLLEQQPGIEMSPWQDDIQLGNRYADLQILVVCNAYCGPCARAHEQLHDLVESYGNRLGLTIRFALKSDDTKKTVATRYLLQLLAAACNQEEEEQRIYSRKVIHDWYELMDYDKFILKYPLRSLPDVESQLARLNSWTQDNNIMYTPTIAVNGRIIPKQYSTDEIPDLITGWLSLAPIPEEEFTGTMLQPG